MIGRFLDLGINIPGQHQGDLVMYILPAPSHHAIRTPSLDQFCQVTDLGIFEGNFFGRKYLLSFLRGDKD